MGEQTTEGIPPCAEGTKRNRDRKFRIIGTIALVTVVALGLGAALSPSILSAQSNANNAAAQSAATESAQSATIDILLGDEITVSPYPSNKLKGATEVVDENGIVHGVSADGINYTVRGRGEESTTEGVVSLVAVGDQIATANSLPLALAYGGWTSYDFTPFYQEVGSVIQDYDLRFINQETVMGGSELGYSGYPAFNSPDSMVQVIAEFNFNLVNFATNHIYDQGTAAIERSHEIWAQYPELLVSGSYASEDDRQVVQMIERNGITFAFLSYTYGDNTYLDASQMPNDYYLAVYDREVLREDVERAQKVADVVIVGMHWGTEYVSEPSAEQWEYAEYLADLDVDLVLGTHAHTVQPVKYVTGESGNTIPVVFGLGDFISGWTLADTILSGMFTCDFVVDEDGEIQVENLAWYPLIEWSDGGETWVRFLKDMDASEQNANVRISDVSGDIAEYLETKINSLGMDIPVIM